MGDVVSLDQKRPKWALILSEQQLRGAELMATGRYTQKKIAEMIGIQEQTISRRWKHNALFLKYVDYLTTQSTLDSALAVKGLTMQAIETYSDLLQNASNSIKFRVAQDILNRAGIKDLKFDLLPKDGDAEQEKKDLEAIKKRLVAIVESDNADKLIGEELLSSLSKDVIDVTPEEVEYTDDVEGGGYTFEDEGYAEDVKEDDQGD